MITVACCVLHNLCLNAGLEHAIDVGVAERIAAYRENPVAVPPPRAAFLIQRRLINDHAWLPNHH
jgi:hypothetical protein